jgi:hypothetical protein
MDEVRTNAVPVSDCPPELMPVVRRFLDETMAAICDPECEKLRDNLTKFQGVRAQLERRVEEAA